MRSDEHRTTVVAVDDVSKSYDLGGQRVDALRSVSFDIEDGVFMALAGPSGSGKSTLLNILGGLDVPSEGTVLYRDLDLAKATEKELTRYRRLHVGFIFQFYNLIPSLTAVENVAVVTDIAERPMKPLDALALVGLRDRAGHFPAQLSGGEQQRVSIARAIAKNPAVLLCDEPTGALDSATGIVVLEALERVNRELGTTTALITHNADIAGIADRVVHLSSGRIVEVVRNERRKSPHDLRW
jgi:putative ABC transport system ATP-binding protein